jgi:hypothetical protein
VERGVRLLGVGAANLTRGDEPEEPEQLSFDDLFGDASTASTAVEPSGPREWDRANSAVDAIRDRFGSDLIGPARLAGRPFRAGQQQWGPDASGARRDDADTERGEAT